MHTERAAEVTQDPDFIALHERFLTLAEEEEATCEDAADDLPPETDDGNVEYKLMMCGLTLEKVRRRTTQMSFRLTVSDNHGPE